MEPDLSARVTDELKAPVKTLSVIFDHAVATAPETVALAISMLCWLIASWGAPWRSWRSS